MKIVIGFNSFQPKKRQHVALESWKHLKKLGLIDNIYDIQFVDSDIHKDVDVRTLLALQRSSQDMVVDSTKRLPVVRDIFDALSSECEPEDYFIFTNNDVIINDNLIKHIKSTEPECFSCSRLNIEQIDSFESVLDRKVTPLNYEIYGYDTFVFKNSWWKANNHIFQDYLLGMPVFDNVFGCMMKIFGGNHPFGNDMPPFCFHIAHENTWQLDNMAPERVYNHDICGKFHLDRLCFRIMDRWNTKYIINRTPNGRYTRKIDQEKEIEYTFFKMYE